MASTLTLSVVPGAIAGERRNSERHMTIFRAGKIAHRDRENLCLVRNISNGGAMAQVFQDLTVDDRITLDLRLEERISARIVWARAELVGLAFDQPIDMAEVLRSELAHGQRRRAPRVNVDATGRLQIGELFHAVAIDNVSQTGTRILCPEPLEVGAEVRLWIDGLGPMLSFVRWTSNGIAGLAFCRSVSIWDLTTWVRKQTLTSVFRAV
ncbi:PilZ domain-containing protein [Sphingomonas sp.]|uniref:PilZ domain-containing protein n=1 Tax=Sphingomonas sp. TaxID=28214 RepID=UPI0025D59012|nr:PilZ domain-containing protein [Sphingomonas sp.]